MRENVSNATAPAGQGRPIVAARSFRVPRPGQRLRDTPPVITEPAPRTVSSSPADTIGTTRGRVSLSGRILHRIVIIAFHSASLYGAFVRKPDPP